MRKEDHGWDSPPTWISEIAIFETQPFFGGAKRSLTPVDSEKTGDECELYDEIEAARIDIERRRVFEVVIRILTVSEQLDEFTGQFVKLVGF